MNFNRIASVLVLLAILVYGFFKLWFCRMYSAMVARGLALIGYDPSVVSHRLNSFSLSNQYKDYYLGWFIYYPTYLILHLVFIFFLFSSNKKIRNKVGVGLLLVVIFLVLFIIFSKLFQIPMLFEASYRMFQNLFGLPFILLAIEGGKLILQDINKLSKKHEKRFK